MNKKEIELKFNRANLTRLNNLISQTRVFQQLLMFMDYRIRSQLNTFTLMSLCGGERTKFMVDVYFQCAFGNLTLGEQVDLYEKTIQYAVHIQNVEGGESSVDIKMEDQSESLNVREAVRFRVEVQKGFRSWNQIYLTVDGFKVSSEEMQFDLRNYLMRRSKKTDRQCYALEAIHQSSPEVLRFCFLTNNDLKRYLPLFKDLIDKGYREMIKKMYNIEVGENVKQNKNKKKNSPGSPVDELKVKKGSTLIKMPILEENLELHKSESHIVQQIIKYPEQQNLDSELNDLIANENEKYANFQKKASEVFRKEDMWYKNVFAIVFPNYKLEDLERYEQFKGVDSSEIKGCQIFQNSVNPLIFKLKLLLSLNAQTTLLGLNNVHLYKNWHPQLVQSQIKLSISSQNSAIAYQKHKSYSKWYRQRDFLYLRHVFKFKQDYYVSDKSIQNTNYIPFDIIHRAKIVYQIAKVSPTSSGSKLIMECHIEHGGLLNRDHALELTINYLKGYQKMEAYFLKKQCSAKLKRYFNADWRIKEIRFKQSTVSIQKGSKIDINEVHDSQFSEDKISRIDDDDVFFSIKDENQDRGSLTKSVHEIDQTQLMKTQLMRKKTIILEGSERIIVNQQGLIVLPKEYLKVRHPNGIVDKIERKKLVSQYPNFLLRDTWVHMESGGLLLINKRIMAAQDSVITFIISTLKNNIFTGKGGLNISLPVTIFNCDSQLSRYAYACGNAPQYLEKAAKLKDPLQRMKLVMIFGLTHSLLFVDMEKPFNPILGETFQAFIAGCPFYAEQISHHPPISAILMLGRGYKIHAVILSTVNVHLNSADGINEGWYHVVFDDGQQICFQTPPAQFSGFAYGDRKFRFGSKGHYYDLENNFYGEMSFQDFSGIFSTNKWKYRDQVQGQIYTVRSEFLNKFIAAYPEKTHSLSSNDILESHSKIEGRWPLNIKIDGVQVYDINVNLPYQMVSYQYPLNSNTNYRQDLYYRRIEDLSRSQSEKERLENVQRSDRKWREKYNGKNH